MTMRLINGAYLADTARVVGEVELGQGVTLWYGVSIRGDVAKITIGEGTNVQDNAVVHCDAGFPNVIGSHTSIGHGALVHGERVGNGCLIGMGAILLGRTKIGNGCMIAAGAVVPPGMEVPDGMVVIGVPGKIVRPVTEQEKEYLRAIPPRYIEMGRLHSLGKDDVRTKPFGV